MCTGCPVRYIYQNTRFHFSIEKHPENRHLNKTIRGRPDQISHKNNDILYPLNWPSFRISHGLKKLSYFFTRLTSNGFIQMSNKLFSTKFQRDEYNLN